MNCPACGAENPEGSMYCNLCYTSFVQPAPGQPATPPPPVQPGMPPPQMPPGAMYPPPGGQPGFPSSDAYAMYRDRPSAPLPQRKATRGQLGVVVTVLVFVVFGAIGWFGMDMFLSRPTTYTSATSGLSFTYPEKWKKFDASSLADFSAAMSTVTNEIILADRGDDRMTYLVAAGNVPMMGKDWATLCAEYDQKLTTLQTTPLPSGVSMSGVSGSQSTVAGNPSYKLKFTVAAQGVNYEVEADFIQHVDKVFIMTFMVSKPNGSSDQVQKILDSVKFKT
jgi:hypothetical protein